MATGTTVLDMRALVATLLLLGASYAVTAGRTGGVVHKGMVGRSLVVHKGMVGRSLLQATTTDTHELLAIDSSSLPRTSNPYLEFVGDTSDLDSSSSNRDSNNGVGFYKPKTGLWFGHSAVQYSADGVVSASVPNIFFVTSPPDQLNSNSPPVKPPVAWKRVWMANRCSLFNRGKVLSLWCPQAPEGYVALGCVYHSSGCTAWLASNADAPSAAEVWGLVTMRADLAAPGQAASAPVWSSKGTSTQVQGIFFTTDITTNDAANVWNINPTTTGDYGAGAVWASDSADAPNSSQLWVINGTKVPKVPLAELTNTQASCQYLTQQVSDWAPILKFDSQEDTLPTSLDTYLPQVRVAWGVDAQTANQYPECRGCRLGDNDGPHVGEGQPATLDSSSLRDYRSSDCPNCPAELGEYLAVSSEGPPGKVGASQGSSNITAPVYVVVVKKALSMYDLWYQVFYASTDSGNGGSNSGSSSADWEAVVVRLMLVAGEPHVVSVGASRAGSIVALPDLRWEGRNPVLYVARPSHGLYSSADGGSGARSTSGGGGSSTASSGDSNIVTVVVSPSWLGSVDGQQESHDGQGSVWATVSDGGAQVHFLDDGECLADVGGNMSWWAAYKGRYGQGSGQNGACNLLWHPWLTDGDCQAGYGAAAPSTREPERNWQVNGTDFPMKW